MIVSIAFGIILAALLWPLVCWLIGFALGAIVEILGDLAALAGALSKPSFTWQRFLFVGVPKTILVFLGAMFSFYGVFVSIWYVASLITPDSTQQMTATFLGTFGFLITAAILWGKHQNKNNTNGVSQ